MTRGKNSPEQLPGLRGTSGLAQGTQPKTACSVGLPSRRFRQEGA